MLAKVANRVRSRSAAQKSSTSPVQQNEQVVQVHIAPELLRWSDFSTPFPSVSLGGYSRFYDTHMISEPTEPLPFCPLLSQQPERSPSSEIPPKSLLFDTPPRPSCLPMIREASLESLTLNASLESLTLNKPRNLTITTNTTPPHSLKRRQRRLLRTPSIERDFGSQSLSDTSTTEASANASPTDIHSSLSSSDSHERPDSNYSEFPITPSLSFEDGNISVMLSTGVLDRLSPVPHESESGSVMASPTTPASCVTMKMPHRRHYDSEAVVTRPISSVSYSTARSDFGEI